MANALLPLLLPLLLLLLLLLLLAGVYVWSVGSFDVFGVHPVSSSSEGTFADPAIISMVKKINGVS
jgi:hypothetical protein